MLPVTKITRLGLNLNYVHNSATPTVNYRCTSMHKVPVVVDAVLSHMDADICMLVSTPPLA